MPIYEYKCPFCDKVKDVLHTMAELDNPSNKTLEQITCNANTCEHESQAGVNGTLWQRQVTQVAMGKFAGMNNEQKKNFLKKRSSDHFKKEIEPRKAEIQHEQLKGKFGQ